MMQVMIRTLEPGEAAPRVTSLEGRTPEISVAGASEVAVMLSPGLFARSERVGSDLVLVLDSGQRVTLVDFFAEGDAHPQLLFAGADGEVAVLELADDSPGVLRPLHSEPRGETVLAQADELPTVPSVAAPVSDAPATDQGAAPGELPPAIPAGEPAADMQGTGEAGGGGFPMLVYGGLALAGQAAIFAAGSLKGGSPKITLETPITEDGIVNAEEDGALTLTGTVKGVDAGQTVTVTFIDAAGKAATAQGIVRGDGTWLVTDANITGLKDGEVSVSVEVIDKDGDSAIADGTLTLDSDPDNLPSITIITPIADDNKVGESEDNDLEVTGTSENVEEGQTLTVTFTDGNGATVTATTTVDADGEWSVTGVDVSALEDGSITVEAEAEDTSGNTGRASKSITLDSDPDTLPSVTITTPIAGDNKVVGSEEDDLDIAGTSENVERNQTVTVTFTDADGATVTATATVGSDGKWNVRGVDISALKDGTITVEAETEDTSGNRASNSEEITLGSNAPPAADGVLDDPDATLDDALFDSLRSDDDRAASSPPGDHDTPIPHAAPPPSDPWIEPPPPVLG